MLLMIDNYDSFTYNLVQYLGELGADVCVYRNDQISLQEIADLAPEKIVISPGPCTPNEAGISLDAIRHFAGRIPILGVCLGHQSMGQAFGGRVVHARAIMHGKPSTINHGNVGVFRDLPYQKDHALGTNRCFDKEVRGALEAAKRAITIFSACHPQKMPKPARLGKASGFLLWRGQGERYASDLMRGQERPLRVTGDWKIVNH